MIKSSRSEIIIKSQTHFKVEVAMRHQMSNSKKGPRFKNKNYNKNNNITTTLVAGSL